MSKEEEEILSSTSKIMRQMKSDAEKWMSSDNLDTAFSLMETLEYLSDFTVKNKKREKAQKIEG